MDSEPSLPPLTHRTFMNVERGGLGIARQAVAITINFDGSMYLDVRIDASRMAKCDTIAKVLALAQRNGVKYLGFVGQEKFAD